MESKEKDISKYLSYILRHKPESIDLKLDSNGWANIDEIIQKTEVFPLTKEVIDDIVKNSPKQRFIIKGKQIRANQGHSINIDLNLTSTIPPNILYHGTAEKYVPSIIKGGLLPQKRQYVHLSTNQITAKEVGARHGKPILLNIDAKNMYKDGYSFYLSENGVYLTQAVPSQYIEIL